MKVPDLSRTIESSVPVQSLEFGAYMSQLRQDVLPHIRKLEADNHVRWYSFLIHPASQLLDHDPEDTTPVIHLRFEPSAELGSAQFIELLPPHFQNPVQRSLSVVDGLDPTFLRDGDWARAWHIVGEASAFVLVVAEDHQATPPPQQIIQLLHFITNATALGGTCQWIPGGHLPF